LPEKGWRGGASNNAEDTKEYSGISNYKGGEKVAQKTVQKKGVRISSERWRPRGLGQKKASG